MRTFTDLILTLLAYLLLTAASLGWGKAVARAIGLTAERPGPSFSEIWLGWCAILLLLSACHDFIPLNAYPSAAIYGLGLLLFVLAHGRQTPSLLGPNSPRSETLLLVLFAIWVALLAMRAPGDYDSGLYHFNALRWINEFAIVPGLGNLHDRLAFNYAYLPFVASLNFYPWFNHGPNLAIGWLWLVVMAECLFSLGRVLPALLQKRDPLIPDLLPALLFPYLLYSTAQMEFSSPQTDRASFLVRLILFVYLWRYLAAATKVQALDSARFLLILGATAVTLKLSGICFASTICLVALLHLYRLENRQISPLLRLLGPALLFGVLILLVWVGRGIITSGYPFYPSTFLRVPTDWTISPAAARRTAAWVYSWGREAGVDPTRVLKDGSWLSVWCFKVLREEKLSILLPTLLFIVSAGLAAPSILRAVLHRRFVSRYYLTILPVLSGIAFWFYLAPVPRFADGLFWLLPLSVLGPYILSQAHPLARHRGLILLFALMSLPLIFGFRSMLDTDFHFSSTGWKPPRSVPLVEKTTLQGLKIYVPAHGDQGWDSPLPGTPDWNPSLQLRGQNLSSGFKTLPANQPTP
jgi:hypothetical protein